MGGGPLGGAWAAADRPAERAAAAEQAANDRAQAEEEATKAWAQAEERAVDAAKAWEATCKRKETETAVIAVDMGKAYAPSKDGKAAEGIGKHMIASVYGTYNAWEQRGKVASMSARLAGDLAAKAGQSAKRRRLPTAGGRRKAAVLAAAAQASGASAGFWELAAAWAWRAAERGAGWPDKGSAPLNQRQP